MTSYIIILSIEGSISSFCRTKKSNWKLEKIEGEESTSNSISYVFDRLKERLDGEVAFNTSEFQVIYDEHAMNQLTDVIHSFVHWKCNKFQLLRWQPIYQRLLANGKMVSQPTVNTLSTVVCPLIESIFHYQNEALSSEYQRALLEHETNIETIRQESLKLVQEKANLQGQVDALRRPELEYLVTFMPLFYENFFMVVNPQDLALMAGSLQTPDLSSTYTEPDNDTVQMLKRKFLNLPETARQQVISFAKEMTRKELKVRRITQSFFEMD